MGRKPGEIDWVSIRQEFIETLPKVTQAFLCEKHGLHPNMLSHRATLERWDILRERYVSRLMEMREYKKSEIIANAGAEWDDACLQAAKKLLQLAVAELEGSSPSLNRPAVPPMHSKDVASSIKVAQDVGRAALGDSLGSNADGVKIIIESLLMPMAGKEAVLQRIHAEAGEGVNAVSATVESAVGVDGRQNT